MSAPDRPTPSAGYLARVFASLEGNVRSLPHLTAAAEQVASRMVAGGKLWLAGDKGFILEGLVRAGGTTAAKRLAKPTDLASGDTVLLGSLTGAGASDVSLLAAAAEQGALAVFFAPCNLPGSHVFIDACTAPASDPAQVPTVSPALTASLWSFTGELVAALTRQGKMPPMYQSVLVAGGRERNQERAKLQWEPLSIAPVRPGLLGRTYLARLANDLRELGATQLDEFAAAGRLAAAARRAGRTAWYGSLGHLPPELPGQVGDPGVLTPIPTGATPEKLPTVLKPGDVVLYVGYYEPYGPWVETVHQCGAKIVTVVSGTPERRAEDMGADISIRGCWAYGDALVEVPGYDVRILPPSGVIQSAAYWMLVAETAAALKG